jgi:hypothetical protein
MMMKQLLVLAGWMPAETQNNLSSRQQSILAQAVATRKEVWML